MNTKSTVAQQIDHGSWRTLWWMTPILAATLLQKFAIPPFGAQGISVTLPIVLAITLTGCITGQFKFAPQRLIFATMVLSLLGITQALKNDTFFISSLVLLAALHLPFVLQFRTPLPNMSKVLNFFQLICGICALCGVLQFVLQPFMDHKILFPLDNFVPQDFLVQNYNEQAPLEYDSSVFRANGVFMMEPSFLSQLLAIAVVAELATRNRWWLLLLYLAVCVPLTVILQRRWGFFIFIALTAVTVLALGQYLYLDLFLDRIHEFNSTGSSGFARFVGGFYLFNQYLWTHPLHALFGVGAGMFKEYAPMAHYPVAEMPLFKMVMEFGICGAAAYFSFLFFCLSSSALPVSIALAISMTFLLNGIYVPFSHAISLSLLIWTSAPQSLRNGIYPHHQTSNLASSTARLKSVHGISAQGAL